MVLQEMIRDETVFVIGEEVARYNGAYKVRPSLFPTHFAVYLSSQDPLPADGVPECRAKITDMHTLADGAV
jgi:hypothetical protein